MSWTDKLRPDLSRSDDRDTLKLSVEEFDAIPIEYHYYRRTGVIGDEWRVSRRRFTSIKDHDQYDCGWDYFTVLGFTDSDTLIIYSMRLEAWKDGRRVK